MGENYQDPSLSY